MIDLYVSGVSGRVNRYYVCSERLRSWGWSGVGDMWIHPRTGRPFTFDEALALTGIGQFYAWEVQRFILQRSMAEFGKRMSPKFDALREAAERAAKSFKNSDLARAIAEQRTQGGE